MPALSRTVFESLLALAGPARSRADDLGSEGPRPSSCVVAALAVDDYDLNSRGASARDGARDLVRLVEGGYHNRDLHRATIARGCRRRPRIDSGRPAPLPIRREFQKRREHDL